MSVPLVGWWGLSVLVGFFFGHYCGWTRRDARVLRAPDHRNIVPPRGYL